MKIEINLTLLQDGSVDIKSTTNDLATILLVMEKTKFDMLKKITLQEKQSIIAPGRMN